MRISSISPKASQALKSCMSNLGQSVQKQGTIANKINKFTEGRGMNPGRGAFLALIFSCTVIPRYLKARDEDERSEILRRDLTTILTICFAMKAIKAGACNLVGKASGLPLTFTKIPENANALQKFLGYFQQKGVTAYSAEDITANFANIDGKKNIMRFLKFVDGNKGNVGKVLTFDKAKPYGIGAKAREDGAITKAAKKLLGENYNFEADGVDIIDDLRKIDPSDKGFEELSKALKDEKNPIAKFAKTVGGVFETISFLSVISFLGFGLPKLNEKMTKDKYFHGDGALKQSYENPNSNVPYRSPNIVNSLNQSQIKTFHNFL